jgi:hypothetical protein
MTLTPGNCGVSSWPCATRARPSGPPRESRSLFRDTEKKIFALRPSLTEWLGLCMNKLKLTGPNVKKHFLSVIYEFL